MIVIKKKKGSTTYQYNISNCLEHKNIGMIQVNEYVNVYLYFRMEYSYCDRYNTNYEGFLVYSQIDYIQHSSIKLHF